MYRARVRLPDKSRPTSYFRTEGEGWAWIQQTVKDAERGRYIVTSKRRTGDVLNEWLTDVAPRNLRPNSLYNYRSCIGYVLPIIGSIKVTDLARPTIERVFTDLERGGRGRKPLSASTLNLTFRVLKMALEYCEDVGYLDRNPMRHMTAPRIGGVEKRVLTVDELRMLLRAVRGSRWEAAYWLLAATGMRVSEVLGLEWRDVDLDIGHIRIERQTGRVYGQPGVALVSLKTGASRREVVVPPAVCTILRWHADRQRLERRYAEEVGAWEEHDTVFATPAGKLYYRSQLESDFRSVAAAIGMVGITPHTLRHTAATLLQEAGSSLKTAQALLGHSTERMTLQVYSHRTSSSMEAVAHTMAGLLGDVQGRTPERSLTAGETTDDTDGDHSGDQTVVDTA